MTKNVSRCVEKNDSLHIYKAEVIIFLYDVRESDLSVSIS
jgi:hypothetical protein